MITLIAADNEMSGSGDVAERNQESTGVKSGVDTQVEPAYRLRLEGEEPGLAARALRLLISDEAHEPTIRRIAREVLVCLEGERPAVEPLVVPLSAEGMKIAHSAIKLLLDDMRRDQADEQRVLRQILDKLPDEHAIRAIVIG